MAEKQIPRDEWIPEIPFDVAEWGDKPLMYPEGTFASKDEYEAAVERSKKLPRRPAVPR